MKYSGKSLLYQCALWMLAVALVPRDLHAQNFVYTNDDQFQNTVSGFSVDSNGALTAVPGSPFATGGNGGAEGLFASNRIGVAIVGQFLFASNSESSSVSVFTINPNTGTLTLVPGSPFAIQTNSFGSIAVTPTPDGHFLMAASNSERSITVFSIGSNGALTPIPGSPFATFNTADGTRISPDGKFLAAAELADVEMFSIAADGSLTSLGTTSGSNQGEPAGVDIDCSSSLLYAGEATLSTTIADGYHIGSNGTLTPLAGSPFEPGVGVNSNVVLLSPDDKTLFVSNQQSNTITTFNVASDGSLSLAAGAPFPMRGSIVFPSGMATSQDGKFLYVANIEASVSVFQVGPDSALTEVTGSPFPTGGNSLSLTAFPPKACSLTVGIEIKPPAPSPVPINPGAKGKIPVAVLSTPSFNAVTQVDPKSLTFGHTGSEASLAMCSADGQDVNNDGLADLVCHFNTQQTGLVAGDNTAVLKGKTVTGRAIQGSEAIRTVPQ